MNTPTHSDSQHQGPEHPNKWWMLLVLAFGLALIVLDGTIVGVSLPTIIDALHMDITSAQWVNSLYNIIFAALLLTCGRLGDRIGRRTTFVIGLVLFGFGSALAGMAGSTAALLGARALQGIGGAFILPSTLSTVNAVFRGKDRAAAFGVWGAVMSGAAALGPLAGGFITQHFGWKWIFLVNVPLCALVLLGAIFLVPNTAGDRDGKGFDLPGLVLSVIGFATLVFGVIEGPKLGWLRPLDDVHLGLFTLSAPGISLALCSLLIAAVTLSAFVWVEKRRAAAQQPVLLDVSMFSIATFSWGNIAAMMVAVGEFGLVFVLPLFLQSAMGLSVMDTGLVLAAMALGAFLSGAMARHIAARIGASGTVLVGLGLEVFGTLQLAAEEGRNQPIWLICVALIIYGIGLGLASAQLTSVVLGDIPAKVSGQGSATQSAVRQIGSALGAALMGSVLSVSLSHYLAQVQGPAASMTEAVKESAGSALIQMRASNTPPEILDPLITSFAQATKVSLFAAVVFLALGLVAALVLRRYAKQDAEA
ncbi:MFS transporter [Corynebacterium pseudopelargi]|uniref:Multidrug resistance protein stp n=1 Tax=Corynebacterium pseudopelargi TaxID=2080757 RepID=A0A3G6IXX8_9CORY|nr:Multidrug resistance protein stp [Corynebacterium pseudopelargi]